MGYRTMAIFSSSTGKTSCRIQTILFPTTSRTRVLVSLFRTLPLLMVLPCHLHLTRAGLSKDLSPTARLASPLVTASSSLHRHHFDERPPPSPLIQWRRAQDVSATRLELRVRTFSILFYFFLLLISTIIYHYGHKNSGESRRRRREWDEGIDVFDSNRYEYRRCRDNGWWRWETMHGTRRKKAQETLHGFGMVFSPFFHLFPYYLHLFRY